VDAVSIIQAEKAEVGRDKIQILERKGRQA
jgi:hypothetical protein